MNKQLVENNLENFLNETYYTLINCKKEINFNNVIENFKSLLIIANQLDDQEYIIDEYLKGLILPIYLDIYICEDELNENIRYLLTEIDTETYSEYFENLYTVLNKFYFLINEYSTYNKSSKFYEIILFFQFKVLKKTTSELSYFNSNVLMKLNYYYKSEFPLFYNIHCIFNSLKYEQISMSSIELFVFHFSYLLELFPSFTTNYLNNVVSFINNINLKELNQIIKIIYFKDNLIQLGKCNKIFLKKLDLDTEYVNKINKLVTKF